MSGDIKVTTMTSLLNEYLILILESSLLMQYSG